MTENPFDYTQPTLPATFIGRWALVDDMVADLSRARPISLAVIGGRQFGISSVLKAVEAHFQEQLQNAVPGDRHIFPLMVNLKRCKRETEESIYACMLQQLQRALNRQQVLPIDLPQTTWQTVRKRKTVPFEEFEERLEGLDAYFEDRDRPLRLIFLLDKVEDTIQYHWCETLFDNLRTLIHDGPLIYTVALVLTGSTRLLKLRQNGSPLLREVKIKDLASFSEADIKQLIALSGQMPDEAAAAVQAISGGHPFIAQYLLHHLWDQEHALTSATAGQIEQLAQRMSSEHNEDLQGWWEAIGESGQNAYTVLVGRDEWINRREVSKQVHDAKQGLRALCYHGLAVRDSSWRQYRYVGTLFRDWVLQTGKGGSSTAFSGSEANPEQRQMPYIAADERLLACARAVGQVKVPKIVGGKRDGTPTGTGWLVAPGLLLTCWHVIEARSDKKNLLDPPISEADLQKQIAQTQVIFDYKLPSQGTEYRVEAPEHRDTTLDYALLRLKERSDLPLHQRGFLEIDLDPQLTQQSQLLVIQHPKEQPQKRAQGEYKKPSPTPNRILYDTPTEKGTSGAPVLNMTNLQVVALHNGEHKRSCLREGTLLSAIIASLKQKKETLYQEIMDAQKTKE